MPEATDTPPSPDRSDEASTIAFSRTIDWAIGAVLGVVGTLLTLTGAALYSTATYTVVSEMMQNAEFESDVLTEAQAIDTLVALGRWSGIGLVVTGVLLGVLGAVVVVLHGRARENNAATPAWVLGVVGAIVSVALSVIPLSPVLGGATAGYLDSDPTASGLGTGTLAGVIGSLPFLIVTVFSGIGLFVGVPSEFALAAVLLFAFTILLNLLYFVALSTIGGYLGSWARKRRWSA